MQRLLSPLLLAVVLAAAVPEPPARPLTLGMLAPPPPGALAFCQRHGGACDPVPRATAMPDGKPVPPPPAWRSYCRRHKEDPSCGR